MEHVERLDFVAQLEEGILRKLDAVRECRERLNYGVYFPRLKSVRIRAGWWAKPIRKGSFFDYKAANQLDTQFMSSLIRTTRPTHLCLAIRHQSFDHEVIRTEISDRWEGMEYIISRSCERPFFLPGKHHQFFNDRVNQYGFSDDWILKDLQSAIRTLAPSTHFAKTSTDSTVPAPEVASQIQGSLTIYHEADVEIGHGARDLWTERVGKPLRTWIDEEYSVENGCEQGSNKVVQDFVKFVPYEMEEGREINMHDKYCEACKGE